MFRRAVPIFLCGLSEQMNTQAVFATEIFADCECELRLTGATFYKVYLNGELKHFGPAPTAHGHARVDVLRLGSGLRGTRLEIEVAGYYDYSYAAVRSPSYLIAEVLADGECIAATGSDFSGYLRAARERRVMRYTGQRHFCEIWDLSRSDIPMAVEQVDVSPVFLPRCAPMPDLVCEEVAECCAEGKFILDKEKLAAGYSPLFERLNTRGFTAEEIVDRPDITFCAMDYEIVEKRGAACGVLSAGEYRVFSLERNTAGMPRLCYDAGCGAKIIIAFEERLHEGGRIVKIEGAVNNIITVSSVGLTDFESFEPYGFKYFSVFVIEGKIDIRSVGARHVRSSAAILPQPDTEDAELLSIYDAAVQTYLCNSLSIFMDCPSRERAGWLCDSYYTARAERVFTGESLVEGDFLENYALSPGEFLPDGMVPMCYPASHPNGRYIPQWSLWLLLELEEHFRLRGGCDVEKFLPMIDGLLRYFERYENELGLLENLPSWNFVEWSRANDWTGGINFPTNMLYAAALDAVATLLGRPALSEKAAGIRKKVEALCYDGEYFHDQATRDKSGAPVVNGHISEVCQYYAFKFGVAVGERYEPLRRRLIREFTPDGTVEGIERANALMGLYMRMELLLEWDERDALVAELRGYYAHMARLTGTLWEHKNSTSSLNHGFASFVAVPMLEIFGIK